MQQQERQHIVFLCGLLCDETVWQSVASQLQDDFDCSICSFAGFTSLVDMARSVNAEAPTNFILVGHSMGGRVALEIYRECPERINMLGLFNTGVHLPKEGEAAGRQKLLDIADKKGMAAVAEAWLPPMMAQRSLQNQELMQSLRNMVTRYSAEQFHAQIHALLQRPEVESLLSNIKPPTLLVSADEDSWSPVEQHETILKSIADAELAVIQGAGHMAPVECPETVAVIIREFVARNANR
jgi:pimeloyl-ACP methyl ester carboxylesterase